MNKMFAFRKLYEAEGNAQRAALLVSYALVIQLAGWDGLRIGKSTKNGIKAAFTGAGIHPGEIEFRPGGADVTSCIGQDMTKKEVEQLRLEQEREFGMLAANMHGRIDKKKERIERHGVIEEE